MAYRRYLHHAVRVYRNSLRNMRFAPAGRALGGGGRLVCFRFIRRTGIDFGFRFVRVAIPLRRWAPVLGCDCDRDATAAAAAAAAAAARVGEGVMSRRSDVAGKRREPARARVSERRRGDVTTSERERDRDRVRARKRERAGEGAPPPPPPPPQRAWGESAGGVGVT